MITKNDNGSNYNNCRAGDFDFFWHNYMRVFWLWAVFFVSLPSQRTGMFPSIQKQKKNI
jgi:hypothetical protein